MSIIVTKDETNSKKLDKTAFESENKLQKYIYNNPESIPLYDIKEDIKVRVICREFPTRTGPIDLLAVDQDGELYIIETKLYKNQDRRFVIAQILDYGTSLWLDSPDFDTFITKINAYLQKPPQSTNLNQQLKKFPDIDDDNINEILNNMKTNLHESNIKFIVLMDQLHEHLKNMVVFLNQNSNFTIYPVQLEYYNYENLEITVPKIYCTEVKKEVRSPSSKKAIPSDDEFVAAYSRSNAQQLKVKEIIKLYNDLQNGNKSVQGLTPDKKPSNILFRIKTGGNVEITYMALPLKPNGYLDFWSKPEYEMMVKKLISELLPDAIIEKKTMTSGSGRIAQWPVEKFLAGKLEEFFKAVVKSI